MQRLILLLIAAMAAAFPAGAADVDDIIKSLPNSLADARPGQWVRYRMSTLFGTAEQTQTLVSIIGDGDDRVLTINSVMLMDDEIVDERSDNITYAQVMNDLEQVLRESGNVEADSVALAVNGVSHDAREVRYVLNGVAYAVQLSGKVPLFGVIRMTAEGQDEPLLELLDFGGGSDAP